MRLRPLTLSFEDPELERRYLEERLPTTKRLMRRAYPVTMGLWLYSAWLPLTRDHFRPVSPWMTAYLAVVLLILPRVNSSSALALVGGLTNAAATAALLYASMGNELEPYVGMLLIFSMAFAFMRLRSFVAMASLVVLMAEYVLACVLRGGIQVGARFFGVIVIGTIGAVLASMTRLVERSLREAFWERARSDTLLRNMLPAAIAERLKSAPGVIADGFDAVTVLFADLAGFTPLSTGRTPTALVELLNEIFSAFDAIARCHGLEKIKTIGDAYMVVGGLPEPRTDHAAAVAAMALEMRAAIANIGDGTLELRIGMHSGPVVAGVIGTAKYSYDLWGDTVNTASRMESHGEPGRIHVSEACRDALGDGWRLEERGVIDVKGKGPMRTWWLSGAPVAR